MWPFHTQTGIVKNGRKFGWRPDLPDHRDLRFSVPKRVKIPDFVDLRKYCSTIEDQGAIGSCTANALVGALEVLENQKWGKWADLSRLFLYWNERDMIGETGSDSGAYIRDGVKSLVKQGVCLERIWEYDAKKLFKKPCSQAYNEALLHKVIRYERIANIDEANAALAMGFPVVFGFTVYSNFMDIGSDGMMEMPRGSVEGGHAVLCVGYNRPKKFRIVRNSWGEEWGDRGNFYMPDEYFDSNLCSDMWVIYSANV
jgi:C1A family cysteine protease